MAERPLPGVEGPSCLCCGVHCRGPRAGRVAGGGPDISSRPAKVGGRALLARS